MSDIKGAFDRIAGSYDSQREALIPCFRDFYGVITDLCEVPEESPDILDVGAGTGLLTAFLRTKHPRGRFTLIDLSGEMLRGAEKRFAAAEGIFLVAGDYTVSELGGPYDAVVSSLSIHHLPHRDKWDLYGRVYRSLKDGGIFINGDQFAAPDEETETMYQREWRRRIESSGLERGEIDAAYERMKLDRPATVDENLEALGRAGFIQTGLAYRYYNFGVIHGRKRRTGQ